MSYGVRRIATTLSQHKHCWVHIPEHSISRSAMCQKCRSNCLREDSVQFETQRSDAGEAGERQLTTATHAGNQGSQGHKTEDSASVAAIRSSEVEIWRTIRSNSRGHPLHLLRGGNLARHNGVEDEVRLGAAKAGARRSRRQS